MDSRGLTEAGEVRADLYQGLELPFLLGPDYHPQNMSLVQGLIVPG